MTRITVPALLALLTSMILVGCETVEGAGRSIENGGEAVTNSAQNTQAQM